MHIDFDVKYTLFLPDLNDTWIFLTGFKKYIYITNFMKIRPVGAESLCVDRMTDRNDKAKCPFLQFYESN
jgi:hypothetical protein